MTNARCEQAAALVPGYLDGELSEEQAAPLRRHLLSCPDCRAAAQDLTSLRRWFPTPDPVAVPAGFAARVARAAFAGVEPGQRVPDAAPAPTRAGAGPDLLPFLLGVTSVAAGLLFTFALLLGSADRPSGRQLVAEPLPEILRELDELNAADADVEPEPGADPGPGLSPRR